MEYKKLPKLYKQLGIENNIKWNGLENNIWDDFQLARTVIEFNGLYDNTNENNIYPKMSTINFNSNVNLTVAGRFYFEILKCMYPSYYQKDPFLLNWLKTLEKLFNELDLKQQNSTNKIFVMLISSDIEKWEKEYGVPTNQNLDINYRKKRIFAKMFINNPFFTENIKKIGLILSEQELEFETEPDNFFIGYRLSEDLLEDSKYISKLLDTWQPCHLNGGIGISGILWQNLEPYKWGEISDFKWFWY